MDDQKLSAGTKVMVKQSTGLDVMGEVVASTCPCTDCSTGKFKFVRVETDGSSWGFYFRHQVTVIPYYQDTDYGDDT